MPIIRPAAALLAVLLAVGLLAACGGDPTPSAANTPARSASAGPPAGIADGGTSASPAPSSAAPHPDHIVVAVLENHSLDDIIGSADAPYINSLAAAGASFTNYRAVAHPSQPNYLALFSGSTQGVTSDSCGHSFQTPNLAGALAAAGHTFTGYSEGLPVAGSTACSATGYVRRHNPWSDFPAVPAAANQPFSAFPTDFARLPSVAFVIPDLTHDMHNGTVAVADGWLRSALGGYAEWAAAHNSWLVLTWDEDDRSQNNLIPTVLVGAGVRPGSYSEAAGPYRLLRTIGDAFGAAPVGAAATTTAFTDIWQS